MRPIQINGQQFAELQAAINEVKELLHTGRIGALGENAMDRAATVLAEIEELNAPVPLDEGMAWYDIEYMIRGYIGVIAESEDDAREQVENMCFDAIAEDATDLDIIDVVQDTESKYLNR